MVSRPASDHLAEADRIRRAIIAALFADDLLFDRMALKGGNALRLAYGIQSRASLDVDISLAGDLENSGADGERLLRLLEDRLDSAGYRLFDGSFSGRGHGDAGWWGGYLLTFKLIRKQKAARLGGELDAMRRDATVQAGNQKRTWRVEISREEYFQGVARMEFESATIQVYTPEMLVIEKLRAICQQMPAYAQRAHPAPRARDFYDIFELCRALTSLEALGQSSALAKAIFNAKHVSMELLREIESTRDFHAADWSDVVTSTLGRLDDFDYYFDFVVDLVRRLEPLWMEETPAH